MNFYQLENSGMTCLSRLRSFASVSTLAFFALISAFPVSARAENEGQADLDKATEQKLGAQTPNDLADVIKLCESALKKGLDKGNAAFANDLMASSYTQRGSLAASKVYRAVLAAGARAANDDSWPPLRSEALEDLEKGVKLSPKQPQAFFEIAKLNLLPGGDQKKALDALDQTIKLADDDATLRADALLQRSTLRKDPKQRLADLDEAAKALPGNSVVLRRRAILEVDAGKWQDALSDFDKAILVDPKQISTYQMKAELLIKLKKLPEALLALEKGHKAVPDNIELLVAKGQILIALTRYKEAAEELTRALAIDSKSLPILELRAALYEQLGDKAKALGDIEKILEIKPGQPNVMHMRAALLAELGKYEEAVRELQKLHRADPSDSLTMLQMGMLYTSMKKYDKAIEVFTTVLSERPDDPEALRGRADAYLNSGKRAKAEADYEKAFKIDAHDVGMLNNYAWVLATAPEDNLRDGRRAVAMATDACKQTEYKQDYILSTLAAAYAETGDFESARKWAAAAVEAKPSANAEPSRKDELKKELNSYKANKAWRESLPLPEDAKTATQKDSENKASAGTKTDDATAEKNPQTSGTSTKSKKKKKAAPKPEDAETTPEK
jgi:tetratricopeptide (TPR) repeat protein